MQSDEAPRPVGVTCPGCGGSGPAVRAVPDVCADPEARRDGLADRLTQGPGLTSRSDTVVHTIEGLLLVFVGAALAHSGIRSGEPLYTVGGSVLAVLMLAVTAGVVRSEIRERRVQAGRPRADALWRAASHCSGCGAVFFPGGVPRSRPLTPEQFRKYVWTEAGYGDQLDERARDAAPPPTDPARPGGVPDHV
ncbi:hypothetical protein GCM10010145_12850 [Streptomyces ruber]|uniref:Uncharacterized protein n=2 Tax=Streptomyces TaxID=1883 RepID=A0A918BC04_9ACTN|nr:hypothetical protein [Streptomyces ruber]GGQ45584.1 hypothetical protein GCM10010145_12850 [Streptomyces ruber]